MQNANFGVLRPRQLIWSLHGALQEGQSYLKAMYAAANFAWVNRSAMTYQARQTFERIFQKSSRELGMHLVYDVCHNIAKVLLLATATRLHIWIKHHV